MHLEWEFWIGHAAECRLVQSPFLAQQSEESPRKKTPRQKQDLAPHPAQHEGDFTLPISAKYGTVESQSQLMTSVVDVRFLSVQNVRHKESFAHAQWHVV